MSMQSAGAKFRQAMQEESPLQVIGAINANHALLAKRAGFKAIYLSGGGVAAGSLGLPDLGISNLDDVLTDVRRITDVCGDKAQKYKERDLDAEIFPDQVREPFARHNAHPGVHLLHYQ